MYPSSCSRTKDSGRTLYNVLYKDVGGQATGEQSCGIYYNIIGRECHYVSAQGKLFGAYQGKNFRPWVFTYDPLTNVASDPVGLGGSGLSDDSHGAPTLCIDSDGYLRVFWGCHTSSIYYRKSTNPYDISAWDVQQSISGAFTYPNLFYNGGYWYLFHRTQSSYPLGWGWHRTSDFVNWSSLTEVIKSSISSDADYATLGQDANGAVHMFWSVWDGSSYKNLYYAYSSDLVTWNKADGTAYANLPINNTVAENLVSAINLRTQIGDVQFDANNRPYCLFNNGNLWKVAHWTGSEWTIATITTDSNNSLHACGCLSVESDHVRAYVTFVWDGVTRSELREYRSYNSGVSWQYYQTIFKNAYYACTNSVHNGTGCGFRIIGAASENDIHDIWIH